MVRLPKIVPVFPLPGLVFFPKTYLPLHIFESRYKEMVKDSLSGTKVIAMVLLKEGWEKDYYDYPGIHSVGCAGKIVKFQALENGRYNILLYGLAKVRFKDNFFEKGYRQAWVEPLRGPGSRKKVLLEDGLRGRLLEHLRKYGDRVGLRSRMELVLQQGMVDEVLVHLFSAEMGLTVVEKQFLLEAEELSQQCKRLIDLLRFRTESAPRRRTASS